jgi:hypothetical protein
MAENKWLSNEKSYILLYQKLKSYRKEEENIRKPADSSIENMQPSEAASIQLCVANV